uniref:MULE transposase domain-containing protein n=1 Tax=Strongyloides venezuelensis TaxID=75913 RepID=A0A0K0EWA9_STRVS
MFRILKELIQNITPEKILLDFEKATMNAARRAFQDVDIKGYGLEKDMGCHILTLVKFWANRLEDKNKYVQLHAILASAVENYEENENKLVYLRRLANLQ